LDRTVEADDGSVSNNAIVLVLFFGALTSFLERSALSFY
jgi:hypothetical protein